MLIQILLWLAICWDDVWPRAALEARHYRIGANVGASISTVRMVQSQKKHQMDYQMQISYFFCLNLDWLLNKPFFYVSLAVDQHARKSIESLQNNHEGTMRAEPQRRERQREPRNWHPKFRNLQGWVKLDHISILFKSMQIEQFLPTFLRKAIKIN